MKIKIKGKIETHLFNVGLGMCSFRQTATCYPLHPLLDRRNIQQNGQHEKENHRSGYHDASKTDCLLEGVLSIH